MTRGIYPTGSPLRPLIAPQNGTTKRTEFSWVIFMSHLGEILDAMVSAIRVWDAVRVRRGGLNTHRIRCKLNPDK